MEHPQPPTTHEQQPTDDPPRIYVACLAAYNHGRLHGQWINANQTTADLHEDVQRMLTASPVPGAEEWAIHDYENFEGARIGEYTPLDAVAELAAGIVEHGAAFAAWADEQPTGEATSQAFEDAYLGSWPDPGAYGEHLLDDIGHPTDQLPDWIRPYVRIETEQLGRDASSSLNAITGSDGRLHLFDP